MNIMRLQVTKHLLYYVQFLNKIKKSNGFVPHSLLYSTFTMEAFTNDIIEKNKCRMLKHDVTDGNIQHYASNNSKIISGLSTLEIGNTLSELMLKNRDKQIVELMKECLKLRTYLNYETLKKLFKHYSYQGKPDMIIMLQDYCAKTNINSYQRNGEFLHYLAIAQCMRGNSERGLSILKESYSKYDTLRSVYRTILRDLIQDSVLNRSEASLMVFKKYVFEFSENWSDHYPLVCLWHLCWASTWFSDQILSNELLENSEVLQEIVKDKATAFSIMTLKDYNEDAVVRLLQILLKYDMMLEYVGVLQVLFDYKLKNRDLRGCREILKNCEVLGVTLPSNQQGKYLTMLIRDKKRDQEKLSMNPPFKNFKLKF